MSTEEKEVKEVKERQKCCKVCFGIGKIAAAPFILTNKVCSGLEKIGEKVNETPDRVFKSPLQEKTKRYEPGNIATGLAVGTGKMIKRFAGGIFGLVTEPYKGAKRNGIKGATAGIGKAILGLVCKPIAGTIDFVTFSVRGVNNMPRSMYRGMAKIYLKRKEKKLARLEDEKLAALEDCAPSADARIILIGDVEKIDPGSGESEEDVIVVDKNVESDYEIVAEESIELICTEQLLDALLLRNNKLREWLSEVLERLEKEIRLIVEDFDPEDPIEIKVECARKVGKRLKRRLLKYTKRLNEKQKGVNYVQRHQGDEDPEELNTSIILLDSLKEAGINVEDSNLLEIAKHIETELLGDEDLSCVTSPNKNPSEYSSNSPQKIAENLTPFESGPVEDSPIPEKTVEKKPKNPFMKIVKNWKPYAAKDNYRHADAADKGGIALTDKKLLNTLRSAGKEMIKIMGKKLLKGDFNLTTISFPIKCMQPNSALQMIMRSMALSPLYLIKAAMATNPVERMKLVVASNIANFMYTITFLKPLNPLLGETIHVKLEDGTDMYGEQTSHHPPVSHFQIIGPDKIYMMYGNAIYSAHAGFNSVTVTNSGKKTVSFKDGTVITVNFPSDIFQNTFIMTIRHEIIGKMVFVDKKNNLECIVKIGLDANNPTDYFDGMIVEEGKRIVSKLKGTYMGYMDFDGVRYWDARFIDPLPITQGVQLPSDSELREDLLLLRAGKVDEAQQAKERIEDDQRKLRKLREQGLNLK
ncbi:KES1_4 [Blepharisma stoltei]|uniref:Uncharacterized protein n=1 Tax=Blepharisma stoltei TaxID=1481888 RepID=A0AAU9J495_9CILI|nr:unnamed protein product [Blepharisma stoltei]